MDASGEEEAPQLYGGLSDEGVESDEEEDEEEPSDNIEAAGHAAVSQPADTEAEEDKQCVFPVDAEAAQLDFQRQFAPERPGKAAAATVVQGVRHPKGFKRHGTSRYELKLTRRTQAIQGAAMSWLIIAMLQSIAYGAQMHAMALCASSGHGHVGSSRYGSNDAVLGVGVL